VPIIVEAHECHLAGIEQPVVAVGQIEPFGSPTGKHANVLAGGAAVPIVGELVPQVVGERLGNQVDALDGLPGNGRRLDEREPRCKQARVWWLASKEAAQRLVLLWDGVPVQGLEPERGVLEGLEELQKVLAVGRQHPGGAVGDAHRAEQRLTGRLDGVLAWQHVRQVGAGLWVGEPVPLDDERAPIGLVHRWARLGHAVGEQQAELHAGLLPAHMRGAHRQPA
jgi:hypothetical protein